MRSKMVQGESMAGVKSRTPFWEVRNYHQKVETSKIKTARNKQGQVLSGKRTVNIEPSKSLKCLDNHKYFSITGVKSEWQTGEM